MPNKNQQNKPNFNQDGAGSEYHKNHAGTLPDYGNNDIDPNANEANQKRKS
ncbi:hypothetical protein [Bacillus sp. FJAT-49736]|uniref:hypothetical protein n=1 Tax=Bacillus sp. FJAT-49736 TaxID=2833582 RepID=UPI001BC973DE|nr:hypothetical protein [Bacillus sp. FJAT-49736]MBS4175115.1 hypothetical protein [Bacillus sp. FJAT-49736]